MELADSKHSLEGRKMHPIFSMMMFLGIILFLCVVTFPWMEQLEAARQVTLR